LKTESQRVRDRFFALSSATLKVALALQKSLFEQRAQRVVGPKFGKLSNSCDFLPRNEKRPAVDLSMPSGNSFGRQSSNSDENSLRYQNQTPVGDDDGIAVTSLRHPLPLHETFVTTGTSTIGFVKRFLGLLTGRSSIIHTHHFANIDGKRTAKRTGERLGTMDNRTNHRMAWQF
jgi:hypothetical protein